MNNEDLNKGVKSPVYLFAETKSSAYYRTHSRLTCPLPCLCSWVFLDLGMIKVQISLAIDHLQERHQQATKESLAPHPSFFIFICLSLFSFSWEFHLLRFSSWLSSGDHDEEILVYNTIRLGIAYRCNIVLAAVLLHPLHLQPLVLQLTQKGASLSCSYTVMFCPASSWVENSLVKELPYFNRIVWLNITSFINLSHSLQHYRLYKFVTFPPTLPPL